jgi:carbamoyltransferase
MIRLGISEIDHDASVALFDGERLLYAVGEERLSRKKLHAGFPWRSIDWTLNEAGIKLDDVDQIGIAKPPMRRELRSIHARLRRYSPLGKGMGPAAALRDLAALHVYKRTKTTANVFQLNREINQWLREHGIPSDRVKRAYSHHFLHAVCAYHASGFENALAVTADGQGGGVTASVYAGRRGHLSRMQEVLWPHSMGVFYAAVTKALGFKPNRHEGKITGLASYEPPPEECLAFCRSVAASRGPTFTVHGIYGRYPELVALTKRYSPAQVAAAFQLVLEEIVSDFVAHYVESTGLSRVVLAGGVFANVKLNQRVKDLPGVEEVFVFPAMADCGLAWGVGTYEARRGTPFEPTPLRDVYWGPSYTDDEIAEALRSAGLPFERLPDVATTVGDLLAEKAIVFRFDGRMEFGPRALGNRSILYHTGDPTVNDWLNKLLRRTEFMPFAPVTLNEQAAECFRNLEPGRRTAAFMTMTFDCTEKMRQQSPAAVHVDGTARPQLIERTTNPVYYDILRRYFERTGVPSLVNTSFNMHEEPIVCSPEDAIRAYVQAKVGHLSIGPFLVKLYGTPGSAA